MLTYSLVDDTIERKVNSSDASAFAKICGCFPSQGKFQNFTWFNITTNAFHPVWGVIWLLIAFGFFVAGILIGIVAFKVRPWRRLSLSVWSDLYLHRKPLRSKLRMRSISCRSRGHLAPHSACPHRRISLQCQWRLPGYSFK